MSAWAAFPPTTMFRALCILTALCSPLFAAETPNILFAIADDWGAHAGVYGTPWVKTPAFDRIAKEGVLFTRAYTPVAKCAPSRAIVLTGRHAWQNEEAGNHMAFFPAKLKSWPEVLTEKGWHMGITGKPFNKHKAKPPASGMTNNDYAANFTDFLDAAPKDGPWCFWYGSLEPHRGYEFKSGVTKGGKKLSDIAKVPDYWPDDEIVRHDMLDYAFEVEHTDNHLARMIAELEKRGQLDNTLIIVTADHGMPFPRCKGYAYEDSNHVPLAIRFPGGLKKPGRVVDDFVNFTDLTATILDYAGIAEKDSGMQPLTGKSWRPIIESEKSGRVIAERDHTLIGKERTDVGRPNDWGYPIRGIVTDTHLFLKNYEPTRWPAGNPETGYRNVDDSPTKTFLISGFDQYYRMSFGKRAPEELYDMKNDPECLKNLATDLEYAATKRRLQERMNETLKQEGDPRALGHAEFFDTIQYTGPRKHSYDEWLKNQKP